MAVNTMTLFAQSNAKHQRSFKVGYNGCKYGKAGIKSADLSSRDEVN